MGSFIAPFQGKTAINSSPYPTSSSSKSPSATFVSLISGCALCFYFAFAFTFSPFNSKFSISLRKSLSPIALNSVSSYTLLFLFFFFSEVFLSSFTFDFLSGLLFYFVSSPLFGFGICFAFITFYCPPDLVVPSMCYFSELGPQPILFISIFY